MGPDEDYWPGGGPVGPARGGPMAPKDEHVGRLNETELSILIIYFNNFK